MLKITGKGAGKAFQYETGQHVVQRIPPTEHNGRKQTSVVAVAVLPLPPERSFKPLPQNELEVITQRGHGKGGQNVNKVASAVRMRHKPTGLDVFINGRDQGKNKEIALKILTMRVNNLRNGEVQEGYDKLRRERMGSGNRGEKIRTYNFFREKIIDHRLNKDIGTKEFFKGRISELWEK